MVWAEAEVARSIADARAFVKAFIGAGELLRKTSARVDFIAIGRRSPKEDSLFLGCSGHAYLGA